MIQFNIFNANRYFDLTISTCSHWFYDVAVWILLLSLVEQYNIHNILCFKLFGLRNCSFFDPTITSSTIIVGQSILLPGWPINLEFSEIREKSGNLILASKVRELSGNVRKSWPKSRKKNGKNNLMTFPLITSVTKVSNIQKSMFLPEIMFCFLFLCLFCAVHVTLFLD